MQRTLARAFTVEGIGVHGGQRATAEIHPAPCDSGVRFLRTDVTTEDNLVDARFDTVTATKLSTTISNQSGISVSTIEHLMAALAGCGVDNALVEIDGPEVPIMDGSARHFSAAILRAGIIEQDEPLRAIRITAPIRVEHQGKVAVLEPADSFEVVFEIDFADRAIGRQIRAERMIGDTFLRDYAGSRTFCSLGDVEALRANGFALGGSLLNAVVVDSGRVLKMLDAIGDLALAGAPVIGRFTGTKAGHDITNRLLHALFSSPHCWVYEVVENRGAVTLDHASTSALPELACA